MSMFEGESLSVFFSTILSFGCTSCILLATWPFKGLFGAWSFKRARYTWNNHICMTWFLVGCIGLFTTNLYALLVYPDIQMVLETGSPEVQKLVWPMWKGVFMVNMVMQGLWGLHNVHQLTIQLRGANAGTDAEFRRPYGMFLWSILGACGGDFFRNLIFIYLGALPADDTLTWVTGLYSVICLVLLTGELGYFMAKEMTWGMSMEDDYGKNDAESELIES